VNKKIKYERLSKDIKIEIENYTKNEENKKLTTEEAMLSWFDEKFEDWIIVKYGSKDSDERRKNFRLDVEIPVKVVETLIESSSEDVDSDNIMGTILNISRGGVYFKYEKPIEISSIVKVLIDLSLVDKELSNIEALAMVVRVDNISDNKFGIGIMFSSTYENAKKSLDLFIFDNIAYYLYNK